LTSVITFPGRGDPLVSLYKNIKSSSSLQWKSISATGEEAGGHIVAESKGKQTARGSKYLSAPFVVAKKRRRKAVSYELSSCRSVIVNKWKGWITQIRNQMIIQYTSSIHINGSACLSTFNIVHFSLSSFN